MPLNSNDDQFVTYIYIFICNKQKKWNIFSANIDQSTSVIERQSNDPWHNDSNQIGNVLLKNEVKSMNVLSKQEEENEYFVADFVVQ